MVGRGAARFAVAQARIFDTWRCSSCANAVSKNLAWCCQAGSLVSGVSGELADGGIPARKRAVSSAVTTSAARAAQRGREKHGSGDCRDFHCLEHLYSRPNG